jgi:hypothetical protein
MPTFAGWVRASVTVLAAALMLSAAPTGMASADKGRRQAEPEERAAALIRPSVMYLSGETDAATTEGMSGGPAIVLTARWSA